MPLHSLYFTVRDRIFSQLPCSGNTNTTHEYDVSDTAGSEVKFDEHGDGLARYEILNFRKSATNGTNGYHYRASKSTFDFFSTDYLELVEIRPSCSLFSHSPPSTLFSIILRHRCPEPKGKLPANSRLIIGRTAFGSFTLIRTWYNIEIEVPIIGFSEFQRPAEIIILPETSGQCELL